VAAQVAATGAAAGFQAGEARGLGELERAQQFALADGQLGALLAGAGGAGERADMPGSVSPSG
jgi:hypothetical protein